MSERRFTRLKASLSEHGTAAKTRETVSRGIRQSLNIVNNDDPSMCMLTCVQSDYENNVRQWQDELKQKLKQEQDLIEQQQNDDDWQEPPTISTVCFAQCFIVNDEEEIQCLNKPKELEFDFYRHYPQDKNEITSPFSTECIKHYTDCHHLVHHASQTKYFGTVFDTFTKSKSSHQNSSDFGGCSNESSMFTSKSFLTNFPLRPHVFECDEDEHESGGLCGQKMLIREGTAAVIDEVGESGEFLNGWLTLSRDEHNCFLTFYDTSQRNKILWHIEVNQKVTKHTTNAGENNCCFQVNKHIIRTDHNFIDDWIKDINRHIIKEFNPKEELKRILHKDSEWISERLKGYELINNINLFAAYNDLNLRKDFFNKFCDDINWIREDFTKTSNTNKLFKFILNIKSTDVGSSSSKLQQQNLIDSYFYRISLFDCKLGKISEEFRYVVSADIHILRSSSDQQRGFDQKLMCTATKALFMVDLNQSNPNDLFLVLRVERTSHRLSNYICYPILTTNMSQQNNNKVNNTSIILHHVEPYAWSIRPLFHPDSINLETTPNFGLFYKMDQNRLSDEFICNTLNQLSQSTSTRSQTVISGRLEIELMDYNQYAHTRQYLKSQQQIKAPQNHQNNQIQEVLFNPSMFAQKLGQLLDKSNKSSLQISPIMEIQSLRLLPQPYKEYFNILYIYPQSLKFDSQRVFSKARNLCVTVEIRHSDNINEAKPLPIIFGRPHDSSLFVTTATTAVSKHNVSPDFFEEIKVALPLYFSEKLHILFTLSHVSCKKECSYSIVGYSWLPISSEKYQIHCQNLPLSIFASLPNNYLSCQSLGLGKGLSMPDVKVVGKEVFKVSLVLTSSVISRDYELHNTLLSVIKITRSNRDDSKEISHIISLERQIPKMLRNLTSCDPNELIHFSQIIIQQLFKLIVFAASQELIQESLNTILCLSDKFRRENRLSILHQFIYSTFHTVEFCGVYIHDQLIILINKMFQCIFNSKSQSTPTTAATSTTTITDEMKLFLNNLWFLLQVITKSMIQYLIVTDRIRLKREERFDDEFVSNLKTFFEEVSLVILNYSRLEEAQDANRALAHFMTRLCSFFDRSVIFNAFYHHVSILSSRDIVIQELKFNAIATLLSHEHFVSYCNPMTLIDSPMLTMEYSQKHFPVFLILNEFKSLYHQSATSVRQIRQLALSIIRNQLTKHMLDDRYAELTCREKVLNLYLPILSVILENSNRMMDSSISSNPNTYAASGTSIGTHLNNKSPFATIYEQQNHSTDGLNSLLVRSTSEISSTLSSISSYGSVNSTSTMGSANTLTHSRNNSTSQLSTVRFDKFSHEEVRDLFICFLCVVQVLNTERMNLLSKKQRKDLFLCLECALNCFEYKPKKLFGDNRAKTMPNPISSTNQQHSHPPHHGGTFHHLSTHHYTGTATGHHHHSSMTPPVSTDNHLTNYLLQQNLSIQSALITLRTIHLYLDNDREPIDHSISQILSIYLTLMTLPQSQSVLIHLFNSIRYFVQKFSVLLFNSDAFLSPIISKVIKYCNSPLTPIRQGATDLLYCLFATNMKRTRFETIVCVSRLASSDPHGLLYLHSSLNRLEQLASVDCSFDVCETIKPSHNIMSKSLSNDHDIEDEEISITNIVERIREILKATKQIREEYFDPYSASELRLQLANSYARTSRSLLRTWLENLSDVHVKNHDWPEAAMCLCQVIAILIEQLSSKEIHIVDGMLNISKVSENIITKDNIKQESDWLELEESHVSMEVLETIINECVDLFEKGELFELAPHVLKVVMSTYEKEYDHKKLSVLYTKIAKMHSKAQEINDSGKRIFDSFFRVAFYYLNTGQKLEYIYKMTKLVTLAEMTTKMQQFYPNATFLAADSPAVQQIEMSSPNQNEPNGDVVIPNGNLSAKHYQCSNLIVVITHVTPYIENARNQFEKNVGVQHFVYEQRLDSKIAQSVADQYKKRVILTAAHSFPYFLKRIPVISKKEVILNPIDVAIDEMQERVHQLEYVIMNQDVKHLQLVLQGSVYVTVNCGPIAYANAFLKSGSDGSGDKTNNSNDSSEKISMENFDESQKHLKFLFEQFLDLCESALKLNERLIKTNQMEYHNNLKLNFENLKTQLDFLNHRSTYIPIFDAISGPSLFTPFS